MGTDMGAAVKKVQDAITAGGGTVLATVDNAADAAPLGATIPANTVVIGGPPAAGLPMLRTNQQAAAALPERYLVHQNATGAVQLVYNGPDYVAVVSGVIDQAASSRSRRRSRRSPTRPPDDGGPQVRAADRGVAHRLPARRAEQRERAGHPRAAHTEVKSAAETVVATQDLANGSGGSGPALRATTSVLVSAPTLTSPLVAAAPTFGLELPLRFVIWLDDKNVTQVGYVDVGVLAARHGLKADDPNVVKVAAECDRLAKIATG